MVQLQLPQVLTLEDLVMLTAVLVSGIIAVAILYDMLWRGVRSRARDSSDGRAEEQKGRGAVERRGGVGQRPQQMPGVAEAVAHEVAYKVYEAVRKGEVKVKLTRDDCPGEVVLDMLTGELKCLDEELGQLRELGKQPGKPRIEIWGGGDE